MTGALLQAKTYVVRPGDSLDMVGILGKLTKFEARVIAAYGAYAAAL
jgi:hypothetical protein